LTIHSAGAGHRDHRLAHPARLPRDERHAHDRRQHGQRRRRARRAAGAGDGRRPALGRGPAIVAAQPTYRYLFKQPRNGVADRFTATSCSMCSTTSMHHTAAASVPPMPRMRRWRPRWPMLGCALPRPANRTAAVCPHGHPMPAREPYVAFGRVPARGVGPRQAVGGAVARFSVDQCE
jgi:hypothetical protein